MFYKHNDNISFKQEIINDIKRNYLIYKIVSVVEFFIILALTIALILK